MTLINKFKSLYKKHFIFSSSIIIISASFIGNIFGYLFQLLAGRNFSPADYGALISLFALSGIIPLILIFITNGLPKLVAEIKDDNYPSRISSLFSTVMIFNIAFSFLILFLLLLLNKPIANYLHIDETLLISFAFAVSAGVLISSIPLFLQGLMRFKAFALVRNGGAVLKLLVLVIVITLNLSIGSIYWGLTIATILVGLSGIVLLSKNIKPQYFKFNKLDLQTLIRYSLGGVLGLIAISSILHIDMILVKHYFNPEIAGRYSSLAIIGRILYYAASPIAIVMLPICSARYKKGENFVKPFLSALFLTLFIGLSVLIVYLIVPKFVVSTLIGRAYIETAYLLPAYGIYMLVYTLMVMFTWFSISISNFRISSLAIIGPILQLILINIFHDKLIYVILVSIFTTSISLFSLIFFNTWYLIKHDKIKLNKLRLF